MKYANLARDPSRHTYNQVRVVASSETRQEAARLSASRCRRLLMALLHHPAQQPHHRNAGPRDVGPGRQPTPGEPRCRAVCSVLSVQTKDARMSATSSRKRPAQRARVHSPQKPRDEHRQHHEKQAAGGRDAVAASTTDLLHTPRRERVMPSPSPVRASCARASRGWLASEPPARCCPRQPESPMQGIPPRAGLGSSPAHAPGI